MAWWAEWFRASNSVRDLRVRILLSPEMFFYVSFNNNVQRFLLAVKEFKRHLLRQKLGLILKKSRLIFNSMIGLCEWMSDGGVPLLALSGRDCSEVAGLISELTRQNIIKKKYINYGYIIYYNKV